MLIHKDLEQIHKKIGTASRASKSYVKMKEQLKEKYRELKNTQLSYIHDGFTQIIQSLQNKKEEMIKEFWDTNRKGNWTIALAQKIFNY